MSPTCNCPAACSSKCRNDRAALRRVARIGQQPAQRSASGRIKPLKPSALKVLGRLLRGPARNWDLMLLGGLGWACRLSELRRAGHVIQSVSGATRGARIYSIEVER